MYMLTTSIQETLRCRASIWPISALKTWSKTFSFSERQTLGNILSYCDLVACIWKIDI